MIAAIPTPPPHPNPRLLRLPQPKKKKERKLLVAHLVAENSNVGSVTRRRSNKRKTLQ